MATATERAEVAEDKEAEARAKAAAKAATDAHAAEVKRIAAERTAIGKNALEIVLLLGLARALAYHSRELAECFVGLANSLIAGEPLSDDVWIDIALALKHAPNDAVLMTKQLSDLLKPSALKDRTVSGVLAAVKAGEITQAQGEELLRLAPVEKSKA